MGAKANPPTIPSPRVLLLLVQNIPTVVTQDIQKTLASNSMGTQTGGLNFKHEKTETGPGMERENLVRQQWQPWTPSSPLERNNFLV